MNVFALDFDGVLCNSAAENAVAAWRGGRRLWSHWQGDEPPAAYSRRYIELRPVIETGWQIIPLLTLIARETLDDATIARDFPALSAALLQETGCTRAQMARWFGEARDAWIARDLDDWLGRHRFYPAAFARFAERWREQPLFIITTKEERFAQALLASRGIDFPAERLYGLDRGRSKEDILEELSSHPEWRDTVWHFVEDRLGTLLRVADRPTLQQVRLYLADWGYNTAADRAAAARHPAITVWNPDRFLMV
jgi:phosphoglycolate phosphatase-like HAD superfamily hydrolase